MRILLSNDDGIHAQGIQVLYDTLSTIATVTVVAPMEEKSATGQTLTLDHPVRITKVKKDFYGINGFPADCTLIGILEIMENKPDLVVSGINRGANLGQDIYYSGTVAAARQAVFHDIPAIAVSSVIDARPNQVDDINYSTAADFVKKMIELNLHKEIIPMSLLNINVPNLSNDQIEGNVVTRLGFRQYSETVEKRVDNRERENFWIGGHLLSHSKEPGTDCYVVDNRQISINPLNLLGDSAEEVIKWTEIFSGI